MSAPETVDDREYDVTGAVDLHIHCGPEGIPRLFDAVSLARHVEQSGLGGAVLKSHMTATASWAQMAHDLTGVRLHGSVVLNRYLGGINPAAVRGALGPSADGEPYLKVVWLPTVHAAAHVTARHHEGEQYDIPPEWCGGTVSSLAQPLAQVEPINVLDTGLRPPLDEILRIVADNDLVLATGHAGRDEVFYVMERADALGVRKVIVTHPCYDPPAIGVSELAELAAAGAFIELSFILVDMGLVSFEDTAAILRRVGRDRTILSTDVGQVDRVAPAEGLAKLGAGLLAEGIPREDIDAAMKGNPRFLVGR
ncbi:MAG: DUF6282 family protein [Deltaproteobacteria bacterium]|nr:DUF6282 family protein [Deltaproteobacteria bacterium]